MREGLLDGGAVGHVGVDGDAGPERVDRGLGRVELDIERGDRRALLGQAAADRRTDPRSAAGDGHDPSVQSHATP